MGAVGLSVLSVGVELGEGVGMGVVGVEVVGNADGDDVPPGKVGDGVVGLKVGTLVGALLGVSVLGAGVGAEVGKGVRI